MYTVRLQIDGIQADGPLEAAKEFKRWIEDGDYIVEVFDSKGGTFTVDFSEEEGEQLYQSSPEDLDEDDMTRAQLLRQLMHEEE